MRRPLARDEWFRFGLICAFFFAQSGCYSLCIDYFFPCHVYQSVSKWHGRRSANKWEFHSLQIWHVLQHLDQYGKGFFNHIKISQHTDFRTQQKSPLPDTCWSHAFAVNVVLCFRLISNLIYRNVRNKLRSWSIEIAWHHCASREAIYIRLLLLPSFYLYCHV